MKYKLPALLGLIMPALLMAQSPTDKTRSTGFPKFPVITNSDIPGAPLLGQPTLITGTQQEIRTEKHGLAYPAFFDWNHDGKIDLLVGEFETGKTGSDIKVYLNEGTNAKPKYSGKWFYAKDTKGDTITNYQWCCIGIHPRLVDLDNDGYVDILSGQYNPGNISWWRGSKDGFLPRQFVEQEGNPTPGKDESINSFGNASSELDPNSLQYWNYSSAGFGDFNGDGLTDLFIGGFGEMKVALNTGTKEHPKFGLRKYILGIDGLPLSVVPPSQKELDEAAKTYTKPHFAGVVKIFITPMDWDGDGVLDLLVTHLYDLHDTKDPVVFFRGVQTDKGLRFEPAKPLFTAKDAAKTFPGCQPNIMITDYNHDGIPDLVIGQSLPTVNGYDIDSMIAWSYMRDLRLETPGKDAGEAIKWEGGLDKLKAKIDANPAMKRWYMGQLTDYKYLTLRHRGYVYVMLGKRNPQKATPRQGVVAQAAYKEPVNEQTQGGGDESSVSYSVTAPAVVSSYQNDSVEVTLKFNGEWYGYANTPANIAAGWIPTKVEFTLPEDFELVGDPVIPEAHHKSMTMVYTGDGVTFKQKFRAKRKMGQLTLKPGDYNIGVKLQYQTCNEERCLPPVNKDLTIKVSYPSFN